MNPDISITLTRYTEPNWLLFQTLDSLAKQQAVKAIVFMLDQRDDEETRNYCASLSSENIRFQYEVIEVRGLSHARNLAIERCKTGILLYIDTDAVAEESWACELSAALQEDRVAVAGGKIVPKWHGKPSFIQKSRTVLDQYSMFDLGDSDRFVHRIVGANFGINLDRLENCAHFDESLGRREGKLFGGEDTKLCADAARAGFAIKYSAGAVVEHQVLPERIRFAWIAKRMYYQGMASAIRGGLPSPSNKGKYTFRDILALSLLAPFYITGYAKGKLTQKS
jgi:GT2 family glycosyltransferase